MATTPSLPKAVIPAAPGIISAYLRAHEFLIIMLVTFALVWGVSGKVERAIANHDDAKLQAQKVITAGDVQKNAAIAQQVASDAATLATVVAQKDAANLALAQANVALAQALATKQKQDAVLPMPELAVQWKTLVPVATITVVPTGLAVDPAGAVATVQQLEAVKPLTDQLVNETQMYNNEVILFTAANKSVFDLTNQVASDKTVLADTKNQCTDEKKDIVAKANKSKRRWFVAGFVSGLLAGHYLGI